MKNTENQTTYDPFLNYEENFKVTVLYLMCKFSIKIQICSILRIKYKNLLQCMYLVLAHVLNEELCNEVASSKDDDKRMEN